MLLFVRVLIVSVPAFALMAAVVFGTIELIGLNDEGIKSHQALIGGMIALFTAILSIYGVAIGGIFEKSYREAENDRKRAEFEVLGSAILSGYIESAFDQAQVIHWRSYGIAISTDAEKTEMLSSVVPPEFFSSRFIESQNPKVAWQYMNCISVIRRFCLAYQDNAGEELKQALYNQLHKESIFTLSIFNIIGQKRHEYQKNTDVPLSNEAVDQIIAKSREP